jgi:hypothetical protein
MGKTRKELDRPRLSEGGRLMDILDQTKWWRSGDNELIRRKRMSIKHKANVLAYLLRSADPFIRRYASDSVFYSAPDDVQADLESMMMEPVEWMLRTPFVQALLLDIAEAANLQLARDVATLADLDNFHITVVRTGVVN